jgi:transposase-like protein
MPEHVLMSEIEIITDGGRRRRWTTAAEKLRIVEKTLDNLASISVVARRNGVAPILLGHLTEAQRRAYRIADNKLTELGGWDEALLLEELRGLKAEDFDLGLIGIPEDELDTLLHDVDNDRAPIDGDAADAIPDAPAQSNREGICFKSRNDP